MDEYRPPWSGKWTARFLLFYACALLLYAVLSGLGWAMETEAAMHEGIRIERCIRLMMNNMLSPEMEQYCQGAV